MLQLSRPVQYSWQKSRLPHACESSAENWQSYLRGTVSARFIRRDMGWDCLLGMRFISEFWLDGISGQSLGWARLPRIEYHTQFKAPCVILMSVAYIFRHIHSLKYHYPHAKLNFPRKAVNCMQMENLRAESLGEYVCKQKNMHCQSAMIQTLLVGYQQVLRGY